MWRIFRRSAGEKDASRWWCRIYQRFLNMFTGKLGDYAIICYNTYGNTFCLNPAEIADLLDIPLHEVEALARGKSA